MGVFEWGGFRFRLPRVEIAAKKDLLELRGAGEAVSDQQGVSVFDKDAGGALFQAIPVTHRLLTF
jgi:hypothetical protein